MCDEKEAGDITPLEVGIVKVGIDATGTFIIGYAKEIKGRKYFLCPFIYRSQKIIFGIVGNTAQTYRRIYKGNKMYNLFFKEISNIRTAEVVARYF